MSDEEPTSLSEKAAMLLFSFGLISVGIGVVCLVASVFPTLGSVFYNAPLDIYTGFFLTKVFSFSGLALIMLACIFDPP